MTSWSPEKYFMIKSVMHVRICMRLAYNFLIFMDIITLLHVCSMKKVQLWFILIA